ncbi:MAG: glycosyltransferase family 2 protein, partial [Chloroflexota bacterium]|nr:glycosyltransferase family 2 protein [Chloroflexota bacterium]
MKLSILIPVYNEQETIGEILRQVRAVELEGIEREIIAVDDCSTDSTTEILQQEARQSDTFVFTHERNQGKGAAVRTALEHATGVLDEQNVAGSVLK